MILQLYEASITNLGIQSKEESNFTAFGTSIRKIF